MCIFISSAELYKLKWVKKIFSMILIKNNKITEYFQLSGILGSDWSVTNFKELAVTKVNSVATSRN